MVRSIRRAAGILCNILGVFAAAYCGIWKMLVIPVYTLYIAFIGGHLSLSLIAVCGVKMLLSTTVAGLVFCIGYVGYNCFKGTEDPDWDELEEKRMQRLHKEERKAS
ncbi:MAG: hypothetical protein PUF65_00500 [Lachnospiraceae bacterium]|nr:hypothetical protein [Lachnospiraceae bacterium]